MIELGPQVHLEAIAEAGQAKYELWFSAAPSVLRRVAKVAAGRSFDIVVHREKTPYSGSPADVPIILDWPSLPHSAKGFTLTFLDDEGQHATEVARFLGPSHFEIVTTVKRRVDSGYVQTRRCTQKWMVGSPWWSEAAVETERMIDGKKSVEINLSGRLVP